MSMDPNTVSNYTAFVTRNLFLEWKIDFESRVISGKLLIDFCRLSADASVIILDAANLSCRSVSFENRAIPFEYCSKAFLFGDSLKINVSSMLSEWAVNEVKTIEIAYSTTSDGCTAAQWLTPEQTLGKAHPYLFTQCQAIHARSLLPCQDTPSVKATYSARVTVPEELVAVMSANRHDRETGGQFCFQQTTPIPSYLIALAVGNLSSKRIGPRSLIWSEPECLEEAAWEFEECTEQFIVAAEEITAMPYAWERYDLLLLPPSFPYGGMENPCLTFLTPSLLAGDRSLVDVVAHEISHSWTGNLVTAASWEHFWLNEGFTMFLERKILARLHGEAERQFNAHCGLADLREAIDHFGPQHPATCLQPRLVDVSPDDVFSSIPYEKGHTLLAVLEEAVGGPEVFLPFLQRYLKQFAGASITSVDFCALFATHFPAMKVDWQGWLHAPGAPLKTPTYRIDDLLRPCQELVSQLLAGVEDLTEMVSVFESFNLDQKLMVFELLEAARPKKSPKSFLALCHLLHGRPFNFTKQTNVEVSLRWFQLALRSGFLDEWQDGASAAREPAAAAPLDDFHSALVAFLTAHGRMKYNRPLYRELAKRGPKLHQLARQVFLQNRAFYHPIAAQQIAKDLELA